MTEFRILLASRVRRDRIQLAVWILSTGLLALVAAVGVAQSYGTYAARLGIVRIASANPTILVLRGIPDGAGLAPFVYFEIFTYLALMAALMSTFLAVRHTRAEEESTRAELVASTPAGRITPSIATLVHGVLANAVLAVVVALSLIAGGLPAGGSFAAGAATGAVGVAFVAVGMLAAQVMRTSRGANTVAVAAVLISFVLRAIGDASGSPADGGLRVDSAWPTWLSPIGWGEQVRAYTRNDLAPLLLELGLAAICATAVFLLQAHRDSGASLVPPRAGRDSAHAALRGSTALAWRLQWPTILSWSAGGVIFGLLAGSLGPLVRSAVEQDRTIETTLQHIAPSGSGTLEQLLISTMFQFVGVLAAACATQTIIRMRQEESLGTAEILLTTSVTRVRWLAGYLTVGGSAILMVLAAAAVASGLAATAAGGAGTGGSALGESGRDALAQSVEAAAAQLPVAFVFLSVVALLVILIPAVVVPVGWAAVGAAVFLGLFGGLIGMPRWLQNLSPFEHSPVPLGSSTDWSGAVWLGGIAVGAALAALVLIRFRELRTS
jgi:ABC-2 type transport system permease protein